MKLSRKALAAVATSLALTTAGLSAPAFAEDNPAVISADTGKENTGNEKTGEEGSKESSAKDEEDSKGSSSKGAEGTFEFIKNLLDVLSKIWDFIQKIGK